MSMKGKSIGEVEYHTGMDVPEKARKEIIKLLNEDIAGTSDLYSQTKQAHWNVKGENFYQLHELFDDLAEGIEKAIDDLAERATALGGYAMGTVRMAAQSSYLPEYQCHSSNGIEHVRELAARYSIYANRIRGMIDRTAELGDMATSDLYTEISRKADKYLWFLEAHSQ